MANLEHLSYGSVSMYTTCPKSWEFRYVIKPDVLTSVNLVIGSAFHSAIEYWLANKSTSLADSWQRGWNQALEKNKKIDWGENTPEQHSLEGLRLLSAAEETLQTIEPRVMEKFVRLNVPGVEIPVIGYIDIITTDGVPGDFKTSSKSWSDDQAASEQQPLFYLAALNQEGISVSGNRFRHYIFVKTKVPKVQVIEHSHDMKQIFFLFSVIGNVWKAIQAGTFPENPDTWKCSPKWCEFWRYCRGKYE